MTMTRRGLLVAMIGATGAAMAQKVSTAPQPDKFALANEEVRELLLLMDTDNSGKVSKQEWMNFMEAEFNRLDKDNSGELDLQELRQSRFGIKGAKS